MTTTDEARAEAVHLLFDRMPDTWDENDIGILADDIEDARAELVASRKVETPAGDTDREVLARAYDPEAFEDHPIEARSMVAAIQWAARRKLASDAAERLSPWVTSHDAAVRADERKVQIERDAAIADELHRKPQDAAALIAYRIRAQLTEGDER